MARDIYYQSVGNPTQSTRLPKRRPELQLPYQLQQPREDLKLSVNLLSLFALVSAGAMVIQLMLNVGRGRDNDLFAFGLTWLPLAFAIGALAHAMYADGRRWLLAAIPFVIVAVAYSNIPVPFGLHLVQNIAAISVLTWLIGVHWTHLCTASPLGRKTATQLRRHWKRYLALMSLLPLVFYFCWSATGAAFILIAFAVVPLFQIGCVVLTQRRSGLLTAWHVLRSWLTYNRDQANLPGIFRSPSGAWRLRVVVTVAVVFLTAITCIRLPSEILARGGDFQHEGIHTQLTEQPPVDAAAMPPSPATPRRLPEVSLVKLAGIILSALVTAALPVGFTISVPLLLTYPVLVEAARYCRNEITPDRWTELVGTLHDSVDPIERKSLYMGRVAHDGSPLLVPRELFHEHAHFLGDSGAGKTSLGLAPLIEQLIRGRDCSVIVIDLKADSMELFATLCAAAKAKRKSSRRALPVKHFSNQIGRSTFAFNPLLQPYWRNLERYLRTDILCGALGLTYGSDYREGYYSSANAAVLYHTIKAFPDVATFRDLARSVGYVVSTASRKELHPEIRKAGMHVQTILDRLGCFEALNVTPGSNYPDDVVQHAIEFTKVFTEPQIHYYHLSATLGPGSSPEIARLVTYMLLAASTQTERHHPVFLVIDEFQRMVARNVEYMLQLARSMGVGVILANQSMQDLRTSTADLVPSIETNCRYRQWFAVSSEDDRQRLVRGSGETVETLISRSRSTGSNGSSQSVSVIERIAPRLTVNDILLASDHPRQSIVRISRGDGYAQYGGMPLIVDSYYHISKDEYDERRSMTWPHSMPGAFIPTGQIPGKPRTPGRPGQGPVTTIEVVGAKKKEKPATGPKKLFDSYGTPKSNATSRHRSHRSPT